MFQNILIATDDLPPVKHAIRYVAKLFPRSKYHLITVINTSIKAVPRTELVLEGLQKEARKALDDGIAILKEEGITKAATAIQKGTPSKEIMDYIEENRIELLVIAKSGKECSIHLGATCLTLLEIVHCPLMIVPLETKLSPPKRIFNPTSGSHYSMSASEFAIVLADFFGAELHSFYIGKHNSKPILKSIESRAVKLDVPFMSREDSSNPEKTILEWSKKHDMMVFSRGHPGMAYKLRKVRKHAALGKLEREIIAESTIPMIIVGD